MKALVGAFNQEKALVGAFSVIVKSDCETDGLFYITTEDGGPGEGVVVLDEGEVADEVGQVGAQHRLQAALGRVQVLEEELHRHRGRQLREVVEAADKDVDT